MPKEQTVSNRALRKDLTCWSGASAKRGRYDFDSQEHKLSEILNDDYFGDIDYLQPGDYIHITDCFDQIVTVRIDLTDRKARKAYLSRIERLYSLPAVEIRDELPDDPGLTYRSRGTRGGGHCILTGDGSVFAISFDTRTDAERAIANCYESKIFIPPAGHEPSEEFVKNAKIWQPRV
jgi:hypothetical protein